MINRILAAGAFVCVLGLSFTGSLLVQEYYLDRPAAETNITVIQKRAAPTVIPPADCFHCREA